ncbi:MAG: hypothetical protein U7126_17750 [Microcoleus sp.]
MFISNDRRRETDRNAAWWQLANAWGGSIRDIVKGLNTAYPLD